MTERLFVHYDQHTIGQLTLDASNLLHFEYSDAWNARAAAFPISISLPLDGSFDISASHHFFVNLLPEANVRQQICKSLGISLGNDFELLKAIGGDCAGALRITTTETAEDTSGQQSYEPIAEADLAAWSVGTPDAFSAITGHNEVRLSLAGAQDKLPVHLDDDTVLVPVGNAPSTYLLKFASPFYSHLPENETFVSMLAAEVALPVVDIKLRKTHRSNIAVIARYDRIKTIGGFQRLHQEDFCQALGISASNKYEKEGGPNLRQCADIIRSHASFPLIELQKLMRWTLFNLLAGNADAHGKNLSLLYSDNGSLGLAPFYDLVCTRNYKNISRQMAMSFGGVADPDLIGKTQLEAVAADLGVRAQVVIKTTRELSEQLAAALPTVVEKFSDLFGSSPVLERVPIIVRKQIRRLKNQLGK